MLPNSNLWPIRNDDSKWSAFRLPLHTFRLSLFLFLFGFVSGNLFPTFFSQSFSSFSVLVSFECIDILQILQRKYDLFASLAGFGGAWPVTFAAFVSNLRTKAGGIAIRDYDLKRSEVTVQSPTQKSTSRTRWSTVRSFKIGILFGFFVDAFKVGS